jgi:dienelactone hydrolase
MRKGFAYIALSMVFCFTMIVPSYAESGTSAAGASDDITALAGQFIEQLNSGDYEKAIVQFDSTLANALPQDKLKQLWDSLQTQSGVYNKQVASKVEKVNAYQNVTVTCQFGQAYIDFVVTFDAAEKIAGLHFNQSTYADQVKMPDSITEKDVTVGSGEWKLPGTLTMPKGKGPFYAVVLVHGSGPNDRDETLGPNKPFRDLAWGLASQGIAVLRYDKRTKVYASKIQASGGSITVKEESIDDALAAVRLLKNTPGINLKKIFVAGHSLGGMLIPRIGAGDGSIAGLVSLAGPARPLEDIMLEQNEYLLSLDTTSAKADKDKYLAQVKAQVKAIKDPKLSLNTPAAQLLGAPAKYWLDLRGYNPPALAVRLKQPVLVLQGGRDYQVTSADYKLWQTGCSTKKNMTYIFYSDLNHLFMTGKGKSTPQEYENPGHVSEKAIKDIGTWIKRN